MSYKRVPFIDIAFAGKNAGFTGEALSILVALSVPESDRNARAVNPTDPNGGSFGLWQINGAHDPAASGSYPNLVPTQAWIDRMFDPVENAAAAYQVWIDAGGSFEPWGAYVNNLHKPSLDAAKVAMDAVQRLSRG